MPNVNLPKAALNIVLKHQILHKTKGNPPVSQEEMLAFMLEQADLIMSSRKERDLPEKGVICIGPNNHVKHAGIVRWPTPEASAAMLEGDGPRLIVVYGEAGSGVSTYIRSMIACGDVGAKVYDAESGGNATNIVGAMCTFNNGDKAIAALGAQNYHEAMERLTLYTDQEWLNNPVGRQVLNKCLQTNGEVSDL